MGGDGTSPTTQEGTQEGTQEEGVPVAAFVGDFETLWELADAAEPVEPGRTWFGDQVALGSSGEIVRSGLISSFGGTAAFGGNDAMGAQVDGSRAQWRINPYTAADAGSFDPMVRREAEDDGTPNPRDRGRERPPPDQSLVGTVDRLSRAEALAARHAPVLVLPGGDYDLPADPQDFIDNSRLRTDRTLWGDSEQGNNIDGGDNTFTAADVGASTDDRQFLDLADNRREIGTTDAPFFYQVDDPDNPTKITYWFFYAYNDGPGPQNHEGDFERITVNLDPVTGERLDTIFSAHSNKHTEPTDFEDVETYIDPVTGLDTGRPIVYVASGSHASYPTGGNHQSDAPDARMVGGILNGSSGVVIGEQVNKHLLDDQTPDSVEDGTHVIDTGDNLSNVEDQPWYPENGDGVDWGEPGDADDLPGLIGGGSTSGPKGPSTNKDHVELDP